ncbi:hypothetical protein DCS_00831 [Drechmeria coniospora]|uniref:Uncharacterized protein n=1 Tax=Drechmeria coniospora TaxID=98403 RepID=A0A151GRF3_DRECN|nr:hypothetical protein DCS_00831 [Drechmeria coniospora]KYK59697.1 hypothetical protein DCS_00831 [Drechmeria coniospora]
MLRKRAGARCAHAGSSGRLQTRPGGSSCRPKISGPSDFCHLQSVAPPARKESHLPSHSQGHVLLQQNYFQPLELSIHAPAKADSSALVPPDSPRAVPKNSLACLDPWADQVHDLVRRRSQSSMSFHIPRRLVPGSTALARQEGAAVAPAKPLKHEDRFRLRTPPEIEAIKERVASAMIEMELLQKRIEHVSECQSRSAHSIVRMRPAVVDRSGSGACHHPSLAAGRALVFSATQRWLRTTTDGAGTPRMADHRPDKDAGQQSLHLEQARAPVSGRQHPSSRPASSDDATAAAQEEVISLSLSHA